MFSLNIRYCRNSLGIPELSLSFLEEAEFLLSSSEGVSPLLFASFPTQTALFKWLLAVSLESQFIIFFTWKWNTRLLFYKSLWLFSSLWMNPMFFTDLGFEGKTWFGQKDCQRMWRRGQKPSAARHVASSVFVFLRRVCPRQLLLLCPGPYS